MLSKWNMALLVIVPEQEVWTCKWGFIPKLYITNTFYWNIWIANEKVYALKSQWNSQQFRHDEQLDQENLQEKKRQMKKQFVKHHYDFLSKWTHRTNIF